MTDRLSPVAAKAARTAVHVVPKLKRGAKLKGNISKDYIHSKEYNGMLKCHIGNCKFETNEQRCIESHIKRKIIIHQSFYAYILIKIKCNDN